MRVLSIVVLTLMLFATARCYDADVEATLERVPIAGAWLFPPEPVPAYIEAIGTPAAADPGDPDFARWFEGGEDAFHDVPRWQEMKQFLATMSTPGGFAEACKQASKAAGNDRAANPELGALACSSNGTVTHLQRFATRVLALQVEVALWHLGAPGSSQAAVGAVQAQGRLDCSYDVAARQDLGSVFDAACAIIRQGAEAGPSATIAHLGDIYREIAQELARIDPETAAEPEFFAEEK